MKKNQLHNHKSTGFKIPRDYFEAFETALLNQLQYTKTVKGTTSTGFNMPKGYTDTLETQILEQLKLQKTPKVVTLNAKRSRYYIAGIAGIAASLIVFVSTFKSSKIQHASLFADGVTSYLETRDLGSYELVELLSETEFIEDNFTIISTEFKKEHLENYLLNHSDIETILDY